MAESKRLREIIAEEFKTGNLFGQQQANVDTDIIKLMLETVELQRKFDREQKFENFMDFIRNAPFKTL